MKNYYYSTFLLLFIFHAHLRGAGTTVPEVFIVEKSHVALGAYSAKERKEAFYKIKNTGGADLVIKKVRKVCGCAEAAMDKSLIKPGETGLLKVVILEDSIYGSFCKNVYVESNDPKKRFTTLKISGTAVPLLKIKPKKNIFAGTIPVGKTWTQEFLLTATQDDVQLAQPVTSKDVPVQVDVKQQDNRTFLITAKITPAKKPGRFKCIIKIPVENPAGWKAQEILIIGAAK